MRSRPVPGAVYAIADAELLGSEAVPGAVAAMAGAGISWIQLRGKRLSGAAYFELAECCCRALAGSGAALWLDDRVDVAALLPVAGVHLGQRDLPAAAARETLGPDLWLGASTHNSEELRAAAVNPEVDVIAVGPIYQTTSKEGLEPVVGLPFLRWARKATNKPLIAIGGIDVDRLPAVLDAGADSAAVLGAVCRGDVAVNARRLLTAAHGARARA